MGCASSKESRCRHCQSPYSPVPRSYSMHVHHPPQSKGDSYHVVALTSTTLGSLKIDPCNVSANQNLIHNHRINGTCFEEEEDKENREIGNENVKLDEKKKDFAMGVIEAKTWSSMINEKIPKIVPKTPVRTPPGEPETINAWELMEGLEDISPLRSPNHLRSFSFDVVRSSPSIPAPFDLPKSRLEENADSWPSPKPMWLQMADNDRNSNPNSKTGIHEMMQESIQEPPSDDTFNLRDDAKNTNGDVNVIGCKLHSFTKEPVVVYFTSLRGVRKTYEDCCHVRVILKSLGVRLDERDVSMHSGFKDELKELLGEAFNGGSLPKVFIGRTFIGGAEEIRRLHEEGQLEKMLEDCDRIEDGDNCGSRACEACGDIRFVPCETCSGSCKIYYEGNEVEEEGEDAEGELGFQRCPDCNENGLIRCPICCY